MLGSTLIGAGGSNRSADTTQGSGQMSGYRKSHPNTNGCKRGHYTGKTGQTGSPFGFQMGMAKWAKMNYGNGANSANKAYLPRFPIYP